VESLVPRCRSRKLDRRDRSQEMLLVAERSVEGRGDEPRVWTRDPLAGDADAVAGGGCQATMVTGPPGWAIDSGVA
jgi:hypothetical protein